MDAPRAPVFHRSSPPRVPGIAAALGLIALYFLLQFGLVGVLVPALAVFRQRPVDLLSLPIDLQALVMVGAVSGATLVLLAVVRRGWPQLWSQGRPPGFGFAPAKARSYAIAALAGVLMPVLGGLLTQWLAQGQDVPQDVRQLGHGASLGPRLVLAVAAVGLGPLVEELLFRGVLLSALLRRWPALQAAAASSLLFALVHLPDLAWKWYAVPNLALLGAVLAVLRLRSGSILPAMLAHGLNNLIAVLAWFLAA